MQPSSVNSVLTAIDHFYQFPGVEKSKVKREDLSQIVYPEIQATS
jgi:hypothetical protein